MGDTLSPLDHGKKRHTDLSPLRELLLGPTLRPLRAKLADALADTFSEFRHGDLALLGDVIGL
jgi:hypothetical protein